MKSLMRKLKRRRTLSSEAEPDSPGEVFELQSVPDHKKRIYKPQPPTVEKDEQALAETYPEEAVLLDPPAVILTTPEGLDIDTFAHGLMDIVDESGDVEDEWGSLLPPPLLAEPPKTPNKRRPPPPRPERPVGFCLEPFVLGPPDEVGPIADSDSDSDSDRESDSDRDSDATLISSLFDSQDADGEQATSLWWSWSSSDASSSDSSSSSSNSESDEMDLQYTRHTVGKTLYTQITDGFVSFPALSPDGSDDMAIKTFLDELDPQDMREAQELLMGSFVDDDDDDDDDGTNDLIKAVASVESEWANAFSRPVPRWLWLKSSNSFPVYHLGPNDLRHGPSKLRLATSLVDEASPDGALAESGVPSVGAVEEVARADVVYL